MNKTIPLLALRTFVMVGKLGSIKTASKALHITSGAVSQQIRLLEDRVGTQLFIRQRYGVCLTEAGAKIYPILLKAFNEIDSAIKLLDSTKGQQTLAISAMPAFAALWLIPRLNSFTQQHPELEIQLETTSDVIDLKNSHVDIALRHGLGNYPELDVTWLMSPILIPVASPTLINSKLPITEPEDCLNYPLLQDSDRTDWRLWFSAYNVNHDPRSERGPSFKDDILLIKAAESGQGIALVHNTDVQEQIATGSLIQVINKPWPTHFAYYIVSDPDNPNQAAIAKFTVWILNQVAQI